MPRTMARLCQRLPLLLRFFPYLLLELSFSSLGCPDGCQNCPNSICDSPLHHLFIIDGRMSEWNKGMHWNSYTEEIDYRNFDYQVNQFDIGRNKFFYDF